MVYRHKDFISNITISGSKSSVRGFLLHQMSQVIKCQSTLTEHYYWNSIRGPIHQLEAKSDPVCSQQFAS